MRHLGRKVRGVILTCLWILLKSFEELQQEDCFYNFSYSDYEASRHLSMVMAVSKYVSAFRSFAVAGEEIFAGRSQICPQVDVLF